MNKKVQQGLKRGVMPQSWVVFTPHPNPLPSEGRGDWSCGIRETAVKTGALQRKGAIHSRRENSALMGFTLIELLVVISIIGLLAALVVPLSGIATTKMRISRTKSDLNNLVTAIETYKLEAGEYPPDNGKLKNLSATDPLYTNAAAINPLFYELVGAVFTNKQFQSLALNERVTSQQLQTAFNVSGVRNSARGRSGIDYKGYTAKPSDYAELQGSNVMVLKVAVPGPFTIQGLKGEKINPWFYDASSTNRHNMAGFDLWAVIFAGGQTNVIGNWKD
jgi:prepilin-type N-terminal cleavage/methylation domain-containing protein